MENHETQDMQIVTSSNKKNRRFLWGLLTGIFGTIGLGCIAFVIVFLLVFTGQQNVGMPLSVKLQAIETILNQNFLFQDRLEHSRMQEGLFRGFVDSLGDPYTVYFDAESTQRMLDSRRGTYYGIGATLTMDPERNLPRIISTFPDSPAQKAGIQGDDFITAVNGESVTGLDLSEVVSQVMGPEGTDVTIQIDRAGQAIEITVTRGAIEVPSIEHEMIGEIGYLRIMEFDAITTNQFNEAMADLKAHNMKGLVVDLRDNPGGNLDTVLAMLDTILPAGPIMSMTNASGEVTTFDATGATPFELPMVVLVNGNSASASEIFSAAVQDYGIATIVGTQTFGKGLVQSIFNLPDGSSVKVTIAEYLSAKGNRINQEGVTPDVEIAFDKDAPTTTIGELEIDNQLQKALDVMKEKLAQ